MFNTHNTNIDLLKQYDCQLEEQTPQDLGVPLIQA